jgi:transposase
MPRLPLQSRNRIEAVIRAGGKSVSQLARAGRCSRRTIYRIREKLGCTKNSLPRGRPRKLTPRDERRLVRLVTTISAEDAPAAANALESEGGPLVSSQTVRRALQRQGLHAFVKPKRHLLLPPHKKQRMKFAHRYKDWTVDDWSRVVWLDETKINRFGSDGRCWSYKRKDQARETNAVETVKYGGGRVMVWGCMTWNGLGHSCRILGNMDASLYVEILKDEFLGSLELHDLDEDDVVFQQDNDPKHKSLLAHEWFSVNWIDVLEWPAQSPDLNPIEHLWHYLKRQAHSYEAPAAGVEELWKRVEKEWENIPASVCQDLIATMPDRIRALIKARGGHTRY